MSPVYRFYLKVYQQPPAVESCLLSLCFWLKILCHLYHRELLLLLAVIATPHPNARHTGDSSLWETPAAKSSDGTINSSKRTSRALMCHVKKDSVTLWFSAENFQADSPYEEASRQIPLKKYSTKMQSEFLRK